MVREEEQGVKYRAGMSGNRSGNWVHHAVLIFKSLHNYHYGTFVNRVWRGIKDRDNA